jgi:hypothetical protein
LIFLPFFNFGHFFLDIVTLTTGQLDILTNAYIPGPGFPWSQLYEKIPSKVLPSYGGAVTSAPFPVDAWYFMLMNCGFYGFLLWFFDNVIPNEFGYSRPVWFFLLPSYWGIKTFDKTSSVSKWHTDNGPIKASDKFEPDADDDFREARDRANDSDFVPALKILNLRKVYSTTFGAQKVAVQNSSFTLKEGTLLALLGQNGAGIFNL